MKKLVYGITILLLLFSCGREEKRREEGINKSETDNKLLETLGGVPEKPKLSINTLETVELKNG